AQTGQAPGEHREPVTVEGCVPAHRQIVDAVTGDVTSRDAGDVTRRAARHAGARQDRRRRTERPGRGLVEHVDAWAAALPAHGDQILGAITVQVAGDEVVVPVH